MEKKKAYNNPEYTIIYFDVNDIITTSDTLINGNLESGGNGGDLPFDDYFGQ